MKKFGKKVWAVACVVVALVSALVVSAFAVDPTVPAAGLTPELVTSIGAQFQGMVDQLISLIVSILPIGLTLLGVSIGVAYAMKWIKKITKA